jgi:uncharacterized protein YcfJ
MTRLAYTSGCYAAFRKLGMQLQFDSPAQAAAHQQTRDTVGGATGFVGDLAGSTLGGLIGSAGGVTGTVGGSLAGGAIGGKLLSAPATTAVDAAHDVQQRTRSTYNQTLGQLNMAGGLPAGARV